MRNEETGPVLAGPVLAGKQKSHGLPRAVALHTVCLPLAPTYDAAGCSETCTLNRIESEPRDETSSGVLQ